jgi:hypothetical protein
MFDSKKLLGKVQIKVISLSIRSSRKSSFYEFAILKPNRNVKS